jgi:RNA polymerase sigma factor (sigma-70 family)
VLEADDRRARVRRALDALPERERRMLLLRYEGFSYREIGNVLAIHEGSVGTLLARAKAAFRQALVGPGEESSRAHD